MPIPGEKAPKIKSVRVKKTTVKKTVKSKAAKRPKKPIAVQAGAAYDSGAEAVSRRSREAETQNGVPAAAGQIDPAEPAETAIREGSEQAEEIGAPEIHVETDDDAKKARPLGLYKKIAFAFISLTAILLAVVFYFVFVKVDIKLIPDQERVSNNLIFDIYDKDKNQSLGQGAIAGVVKEIEVSETKRYESSGSEPVGEEVAGKVMIINNYNKSQPLIATTRLLSSDNKLFRIKNTITVPAGGSAEAEVYADKASPEMSVDGPAKWIIPGLWAGLQDKIYGESKEPIKYQKKVKKTISQEDIDLAIKDLEGALFAKTKADLSQAYKGYDQLIYNLDSSALSSETDGKAGEEKDGFTVTVRAKAAVVAFKDEPLVKMAKDKIAATIPETKELADFDEGKMAYNLDSFNFEQGVATANVVFEGKITLKDDAVVVKKEDIVGLTKDQLNAYLSSMPELAGAEVRFFPSFITKVPDLVDRINITIKR